MPASVDNHHISITHSQHNVLLNALDNRQDIMASTISIPELPESPPRRNSLGGPSVAPYKSQTMQPYIYRFFKPYREPKHQDLNQWRQGQSIPAGQVGDCRQSYRRSDGRLQEPRPIQAGPVPGNLQELVSLEAGNLEHFANPYIAKRHAREGFA